MKLTDATIAYQSLLEGHRALTMGDDHGLLEDVTRELEKAREAMEIAWLTHVSAA